MKAKALKWKGLIRQVLQGNFDAALGLDVFERTMRALVRVPKAEGLSAEAAERDAKAKAVQKHKK